MSANNTADTGFDSRIERIAYLFQEQAVQGAKECRIELVKTSPGWAKVVQYEGGRGTFLELLNESLEMPSQEAMEIFLRLRKHKLYPAAYACLPYHEIDLSLVQRLYLKMQAKNMAKFDIDLYLRSDGQNHSTIMSMAQYAHLTGEDQNTAGNPILAYKNRRVSSQALRELEGAEALVDESARDAMAYCQVFLAESKLSTYGLVLGHRDANDQIISGLPIARPEELRSQFKLS